MNKSDQKQVDKALAGAAHFAATISQRHANDYLARALSIIARSALTTKTKHEISQIANKHGVMFNPEFIV
jgi:hypothetical protein